MENSQQSVANVQRRAANIDDETERIYDLALLALANPVRRSIVSRLAHRERTLVDLALDFPDKAANLPYHVRALRDGGLITSRRLGTRQTVYVVRPLIREIIEMISRLSD